MKTRLTGCAVLCMALFPLAAMAQPLSTAFTYQGQLKQSGQPLNTTADFEFRLFDAASGGAQVGSAVPISNVNVVGGVFTVSLNFGVPAFNGDQRFLQVAVRSPAGSGIFTTLNPRQPMTAVPYALYALSGPGSGGPWAVSGNNVFNTNTGNVGIGTTTPGAQLHIAAAVNDPVLVLQDAGPASTQTGYVSFWNNAGAETGWVGFGSPSSPQFSISNARIDGDVALFSGTDGSIRLATNTQAMIVNSAGRVGIGTVAPAEQLDVQSSREGHYAVLARSTGFLGSGVYGEGESRGVYGNATGINIGIGVQGVGDSRGVYAEATGNGFGIGLQGVGDDYGVFSNGDLGATGIKSFRIDHPAAPDTKYLLHYCTEAPQPENSYNGIAGLDDRGEADVVLPEYFAAINKDPRYQLTAVGRAMPLLHVAEEVSADALAAGAGIEPGQVIPAVSFRIAGGAPGGKVSWEVKAVRNDRWVQQRGAPVEVEKAGRERGTYQHPLLYGQPREKGLSFRDEGSRAISREIQPDTKNN